MEKIAVARGCAMIEAKSKLIEVIVQMFVAHRSLVGIH
jgi:hypothetical protein